MKWILYEVNVDRSNEESTKELVELSERPTIEEMQAKRLDFLATADGWETSSRVSGAVDLIGLHHGPGGSWEGSVTHRLVPVPTTSQVPLLSARFPMGGGR